MDKTLRLLRNPHKAFTRAKKRDLLLDQMLAAYRYDFRINDALDPIEKSLEKLLIEQIYYSPKRRVGEEFSPTLDAAILSLRGWLLAFSAVALLLFSLSFNKSFHNQSKPSFEEVLTYNADGVSPESLILLGE